MTPHTAGRAAAALPRVLIVDDERRNRDLVEVMLSAEGYNLLTASSGDEAIRTIANERPDLILLDVMMPGMDGYQVATRLKADPATAHIPIIMLSALDDANSRKHGMTAGATEFLTKPINRNDLCRMVKQLMPR